MKKIHLFGGPSLRLCRFLLKEPCIELHPPAQRHSFLSVPASTKDIFLLVDGYYGSVPAISHYEIIEIMSRGNLVFGCSSMGALRAAELFNVGMIGIGYVFAMYKEALLTGDDEVAIMHDPVDWTPVSCALVNIRFACEHLVNKDLIKYDQACEMIRLIQRVPFFERSEILVKRMGERVGLAPEIVDLMLSDRYDIKCNDARSAIECLVAQFGGSCYVPQTSFRCVANEMVNY